MWYEQIRYASPKVETDPEGLIFKDEIVPPGTLIKFKYMRGSFLFGTVCTNTETGAVWIDCREYSNRKAGKWRSIPMDKFKSRVVPRKVRKKRVATSAS